MEKNTKLQNKSRLLLGLVKCPADLSTSKFIFFHGPKFEDSCAFDLHDAPKIIKHHKFDPLKKTVFYFHGYLEHMQEESIAVIVNAYLCRHDHNLLVLDWAKLAEGNYVFDAVVNAKQLGSVLAKIFLEIFEAGLNIENVHFVGHSLGSQLAGMIGRQIISRSNGTKKIPRISALDPAFPTFHIIKFAKHLNQQDAHFVDIIHTDAWFYGSPFSIGTADFWPNGGKTLQPGCPRRDYKLLSETDLCSHRRSWWFWAESVMGKYDDKFYAVKAKSWKDFKAGRIEEVEKDVFMGIECPTDISGNYYLQTNGETPFARGKLGMKYC